MGRKTIGCDAIRSKIGEVEKGLSTLYGAPKANGKKIEGPKPRVASIAKDIAHLEAHMKDDCSICFRVIVENSELQRKVSSKEE